MRQQNNDWLLILVFIIFAISVVAVNTWNTKQICKTSEVYWVKGTQYSCKWFK